MIAPLAVSLTGLALLLMAEGLGSTAGRWVTKPFASAGFVGVGLAVGGLETTWGRTVVVGLLLCMAGDLLLIPASRRTFLVGLISFLVGHLAFGVAFALRGAEVLPAVAAAVGMLVPGAAVLRWLWPHVPTNMRGPVVAYVVVISVMLASAVGLAARPDAPALVLPGAVLFYLSDLFVARNRFIAPGFVNRAVGLPLYYGGTLLIAASAGS